MVDDENALEENQALIIDNKVHGVGPMFHLLFSDLPPNCIPAKDSMIIKKIVKLANPRSTV